MNSSRFVLVFGALVVVSAACVEYPDRNKTAAQQQPTATQPPATATQPPATATTVATATTPTATTYPTTTTTGFPTTFPTTFPTGTGLPAPGAFTLPGVCIPIGSWTKQFDSGIPASGTVEISAPVMFNQFPVNDNVVVASAPLGALKGTGAMTSTNDLSIDVMNGVVVVSYTCHFSGANCNQGACTVTKGSLGGFKLNKK